MTYIVADPETKRCAIIDSVWDFDVSTGALTDAHNDKVVNYVLDKNLKVEWILETHIHADHVTGAQRIKPRLGGKIAVGSRLKEVQATFATVFNYKGFKCDGSQFDHMFDDNEEFKVGNIQAKVLFTPGHTPSCVTYLIGDALFTGDSIFLPDSGTGRCDFPNGSSIDLYESSRRLYALPDSLRFFVGHDYAPNGREIKWETTLGEEKKSNKMLREETLRNDFTTARDARDATLPPPKLLLPSIQINMRAGHLPESDDNGVVYLLLPLHYTQ
jgi:glyoxylase-like metal-dependent hydrolase (beta-lactamase superfamily II)